MTKKGVTAIIGLILMVLSISIITYFITQPLFIENSTSTDLSEEEEVVLSDGSEESFDMDASNSERKKLNAWIDREDNKNYFVIENGGVQKQVAEGEIEYHREMGTVDTLRIFSDVKVSQDKKFVGVHVSVWEGSLYEIYSPEGEKLLSLPVPNTIFYSENDKYLVACASSMLHSYHYAQIYDTSDWSIIADIDDTISDDGFVNDISCKEISSGVEVSYINYLPTEKVDEDTKEKSALYYPNTDIQMYISDNAILQDVNGEHAVFFHDEEFYTKVLYWDGIAVHEIAEGKRELAPGEESEVDLILYKEAEVSPTGSFITIEALGYEFPLTWVYEIEKDILHILGMEHIGTYTMNDELYINCNGTTYTANTPKIYRTASWEIVEKVELDDTYWNFNCSIDGDMLHFKITDQSSEDTTTLSFDLDQY